MQGLPAIRTEVALVFGAFATFWAFLPRYIHISIATIHMFLMKAESIY
jgi:hypothetical protein